MFLEGNIAAPPTITVFSPDSSLFIIFLSSALAGAITLAVRASALNATAERTAIRFDMDPLPMDVDSPQESAGRLRATTVAPVVWRLTASPLGRVTGGFWGGFGKNF